MTIPYDCYKKVSTSLWFKRTPGKSGEQGLVGNGGCSVGLMSEDECLVPVLIKNATGSDFIVNNPTKGMSHLHLHYPCRHFSGCAGNGR
ncbi:hypothetical protein NP493_721g02006 [Ridgeia piscesae]|uniref:Uncharacterized protein n=1 Tax=Ridgeia piscesae TaxID=27915 RepID=A0AAD9NQB5_RIDPI|nr:hypothetical protein NP493_721g02006 [Ridgeia piscesae]